MSGSTSPTTNVPDISFTATGVVIPAESAVLAGVEADVSAAFGGGINPGASTPQGQLAGSLTAIVGDKNAAILYIANNVDPAFAEGRMQDAIARIYFLTRLPAQSTTVQCLCTGLNGVVIPIGAQAIATDGNIYFCVNGGTIPPSGSITLTFVCNNAGPIPCPANSLNSIYQAISGWDSINNPTDGVIGALVENRAQFEARRGASVAVNSVGSVQAIQSNLLSVAGVLDAYTVANNSGSATTIGGVSVPAHSVYCCVAGGAASDIARAIWLKMMPGCGMGGAQAVTVTDFNSGYAVPYPTYTINYDIATPVTITFTVSVQNSQFVPSDATTQIQNAILYAFSGSDGGPRVRIGSKIYAARFYAAIANLGPWAQVIDLNMSMGTQATFTASISGTTLTVTAVASGQIGIGQILFGSGIPNGTYINGFGTGVGATGTYTIGTTLTISSETMTSENLYPQLLMQINQIPVTSAANINVLYI